MTEEMPHVHAPRQHRDGKEPWCPVCGKNAEHREPKSRFGNHPAVVAQIVPPLPTTEDLAKKWFLEDEEEAAEALGIVYERATWDTAHQDLKDRYIRRVQEARNLR